MVQGGEATSERRRRDGVYQKSYKRAFPLSRRRQHTRFAYVLIPPLLYISPLSPRCDQCEQSAPTVPLQHSRGYRLETLKRRLGFAAVPCQATANLAVDILVLKPWSANADRMKRIFFILPTCCTLVLSCRGRRYPVSAIRNNASHQKKISVFAEICLQIEKYML